MIKNNFTKDTLLKIAEIGIITIAAASSPYFLHRVVKDYFGDSNKQLVRQRAKKLSEFNRKKLVEFRELSDGSVKIVISQAGKELVQRYKIEDMKIAKPKSWDKEWRIVIYDIPQKFRKASDAFRRKIRELGMYQLQKSIWVYPYECSKELDFLCAVFGIPFNDCILYFKTKELPKEKEIKNFFAL